ncbi:NmrA-like family domain-containing protein [Lachnellula willkommii]|uniref:NmrA-like family domain-containing protein n=1 Tax=Lachnellula willkommii TaxID=215461 RepID=A0A559MBZ4_9HELO|nr:NmrA-like family domain-containing protein [Lachnellula willkommii]
MSDKKILVVFGATGNQGGSVIDSILNDSTTAAQFEIVGVTRDPSKPAAVALAARVRLCHLLRSDLLTHYLQADLDDKESLQSVVKNAYAVFAVTNWQEVMNKEREIQQGKNIADVAKEFNVQHLIWSSLPNVSKISNKKYTKVLHFDSKAVVEEYIRSLGIPATFLHLGIFMNFLFSNIVPTSEGTKSYNLAFPFPPGTKIPLISVNKDTGAYVKHILLNRETFLGRQVSAAEKEYAPTEIVSILKNVGDVDISLHANYTEDDFKKRLTALGVPEFFQEDLAENMKFIHEFGFFGGLKLDNDILPEPLETFEEFVAKSSEIAALT